MTFFDFLKNTVLILLLLHFAPPIIESITKQYSNYINPKTRVGVVAFDSELAESHTYIKQLRDYFENNEIKALLLTFECPGGAAATSQALYIEIMALKKEYPKPVIALVENVCTSGGYYIASAADHIIAPGTALIGGIGATLPSLFQFKDCMEQLKIHYVPLKAGAYKTVGNPFTDMSAQEKELMQGILNDSYQQFAADVAQRRKLSMNTIAVWADGKLFSGNQALHVGLIDELGSMHTAIKALKEKALIEGDIDWVKTDKGISLLSLLGGSESSCSNSLFAVIGKQVCSSMVSVQPMVR